MSFGWLTKFRTGSWLSFRKFILNERRDIAKRIAAIESELRKIGYIIIFYNKETSETGETRVTEERVGMSVAKNTALERLLQAYVVSGGNILDISHFFIPDLYLPNIVNDTQTLSKIYPYGGVVYPLSAEYNEPIGTFAQYTGGFLPIRKYPPLRIGGREDIDAVTRPILTLIDYSRGWVSQEIKEKRNDLEARIIKICDLREQLTNEIDTILKQAFGGLTPTLDFNKDRYQENYRVPNIVNFIDSIFFLKDEFGNPDFTKFDGGQTSQYPGFYEDILPDEKNTAI